MAAYRTIYVNWLTKTLQNSSGGAIVLPNFHKYETVPFKFIIVEPDPDDPVGGWVRVNNSNISLTVSINDTLDDATPLVSQSTWTKDTSLMTFSGELVLNTAGMNSYIGSSDVQTAYFEISAVEGTARSIIYRAGINLKQGVTQPTTTSPDPVQEYYTKAQLAGLFVQFLMGAGEQLTFKSPNGTRTRTIGVDNDGNPTDIIV